MSMVWGTWILVKRETTSKWSLGLHPQGEYFEFYEQNQKNPWQRRGFDQRKGKSGFESIIELIGVHGANTIRSIKGNVVQGIKGLRGVRVQINNGN